MLNRRHHTLSQLLLFKGCLSASEIETFMRLGSEEECDIDSMVSVINRWNETNMLSMQIESYQYCIDKKVYYGWRPTVTDDPISAKSMMNLNTKQIKFWKIFLNIAITNSGVMSLHSAFALNRSGMLGIQNTLSQTEILSLMRVLETKRYIQSVRDGEFDNDDAKSLEIDMDHEENAEDKYFVIGPNCFIDLKTHCDSKTEHIDNECCLCSDYVMFKGFKCGNRGCSNIVHQGCIQDYWQTVAESNSSSYKCPSCQNNVDIQNVRQVSEYVQLLSHPSNAIKIINDLKRQISNR